MMPSAATPPESEGFGAQVPGITEPWDGVYNGVTKVGVR